MGELNSPQKMFEILSPRLGDIVKVDEGRVESEDSPQSLAKVAVTFLQEQALEAQTELQMFRAEFGAYQERTVQIEIDAASSKKELSEVQAQCARMANRLCNLSEMELNA